MKRKSSRRDFLRGRAAQDALGDAAERSRGGSESTSPTSNSASEPYVLRVSREAMACEFEVRLNAGQYEHAAEIALETLNLVDRLEDQLTFFRDDSELSHINRVASAFDVEVERGLFGLFELGERLSRQTDGAFDLTATPLWEVWGFARREGAVPSDAEITDALALVGSELVELNAEKRTLAFRKPGVRLNLGGIGKGYALDRCARSLAESGVEEFLIHGGQSSVVAHGALRDAQGRPCPGGGWEVGIVHPLRPERRLGKITLVDQALATSGSWAQSFVHEGRRLSHIIDPRTGWPAEGVLSATAIAPTAAEADALSTAFFVMGPEQTAEYCQEHNDVSAVLACAIRRRGGMEIKTANLPEDALRDTEI